MGVGSSKEPLLSEQPVSRRNIRKKENFNCFSMFCPPTKNDPLGSPMPPTPTEIKKRRKQFYGGLEVENSIGNMSALTSSGGESLYPNKSHHSNGNANGSQRSYSTRSTRSSATIYEGADGEQRLMKKYQMCEVLGVGSTSICHRCVDRNTGRSYACKIIDKKQIEQRFQGMIRQLHMEIDALKSLHHPNIIKLYDVYSTSNKIYIVMELMAGGELFDYVVKKGTLTEAEAAVIVRMVTSALVYMHDQNIVHRDLKPENLLLTHKPNSIYDIEVKIIDFGLAKVSKIPCYVQEILSC